MLHGGVRRLVGEAADLVGVGVHLVGLRVADGALELRVCVMRQQQAGGARTPQPTRQVQRQAADARVHVATLLQQQLDHRQVVADDGVLQQREAVPVDHVEDVTRVDVRALVNEPLDLVEVGVAQLILALQVLQHLLGVDARLLRHEAQREETVRTVWPQRLQRLLHHLSHRTLSPSLSANLQQ